MGILDAFAAEDRVDVKFSTFYELVKGCAEREFIINGLKHKIPHAHILAMLGELPEPEVAADVRREAATVREPYERTPRALVPTPITDEEGDKQCAGK